MSMTAIQAIRKKLIGNTSIAALVSTRVGPWKASQSWKRPYITLLEVSVNPAHYMSGAFGKRQLRIQVDVWSDTYDECESLSELCRLELDSTPNSEVITIGANTFSFDMLFLDSQRELGEAPPSGGEASIYRKQQDYIAWHSEAIPTH